MKNTFIAIMLFLLCLPLVAGEWTQYYFRFELTDKAQLPDITKIVSIDNVKGNWVYAYANDSEWAEFGKLGLKTQLLPAPSSEFPVVMSSSASEAKDWDTYPTYSAYVAMMNGFASSYPNLCQIINVGTTVNGRAILVAKISDNVASEEKEPEVLLTSTIHGDETTGWILMLRLIDTLLSQYGTDPRLANIVNSMELYIGPNTNPDGTYYGGDNTVASARRYNANGIDLNRNYPDYDGSLNEGAIQPETQALMDFANAHSFVFGINYHGGAEVVNYPWDYTYTLHPDDAWFISSSLVYASNAQANGPSGYFTSVSSNGITNGADWYVIAGGRQDWMNYTRNGREVTIECSNTKLPAASTMPNYWNYNYEAMLSYLEQSLYGIHGTVVDAYGNPLSATINISGYDNTYSIVETDASHGDFYRYLQPGTYTLTVTTPGYDPQTLQVTVSANAMTPITVVFGELPLEISLTAGWNLISLNQVPASYAVADVFDGVTGLIQVKSEALSHMPSMAAHFNTLEDLAVNGGYWVNLSSPATLTVSGTQVDASATPISLKAGWNLVAYLPAAAKPTATALASISSYLQEVNHLGASPTNMEPGKGYWIKVSQACTLTYPD
ncbi:MAG: carboxypeptidase regulatory-like domain-containing protein [Candidatus Cloacimonetes bacterium]|nr:carboxypeptidase regulatory-like domain-containing protein [Candidatus Cloacimonadota bacterium]MDY0367668.1 M14 family zinc carboxypeptidase [Candidatus Syntrophosphaera sp.]